jgi:hypothetical protein
MPLFHLPGDFLSLVGSVLSKNAFAHIQILSPSRMNIMGIHKPFELRSALIKSRRIQGLVFISNRKKGKLLCEDSGSFVMV